MPTSARTLLAVLVLVVAAGCASTQEKQLQPAAPDTAALATQEKAGPDSSSADPDEKICKTTVVTGSRVRQKKICLTRREWAETAAIAQEGMKDVERKSGVGVGGGG